MSPFVSKSQRGWMYSNKPAMAERWEKHTPKGIELPKKVVMDSIKRKIKK